MHYFFYIYLTLFFSVLLSAVVGNFGITFPLPAAVIFYLTIVYGWRVGVICATLTGVTIELLYGTAFFTPFSMLAIVITANLWLNNYDTKNLSAQSIPGIIIGIIVFIPQLLLYKGSWTNMLYLIPELFFSMIIMTLLVPLSIYLLDRIAKKVGLPLFKEAKIELIHHKR